MGSFILSGLIQCSAHWLPFESVTYTICMRHCQRLHAPVPEHGHALLFEYMHTCLAEGPALKVNPDGGQGQSAKYEIYCKPGQEQTTA